MAANPDQIEHILSLDFSDPKNEDYGIDESGKYKSFGPNSHTIIDHNDCVVEATNQAARLAKGDVLTYTSDDFFPPQDWDLLIIKEFENENRPLLIKVHDGLQDFKAEVLTIPIMNRKLYQLLGYFFHPKYFSMWTDVDLFHTVKNIGSLKLCEHLLFQHKHYSNGMAEKDDTYIRSDANWNQGLQIFNERKKINFPV